LLDQFLARERPPCPGCKKTIESADGGECPLCGESLAVEVRSLRRIDWSGRGALPVLLAYIILGGAAVWAAFIGAVFWVAITLLPAPSLPDRHRIEATLLVALSLFNGTAAVAIWVTRRRLLRARLWVRLATLGAAAAATAATLTAGKLFSQWATF
jgi:hypothetical protein